MRSPNALGTVALALVAAVGCNDVPFAPDPAEVSGPELLDHDGWSRIVSIRVPRLADEELFGSIVADARAFTVESDSLVCYWWREPSPAENAVNCLWEDLQVLVDGEPVGAWIDGDTARARIGEMGGPRTVSVVVAGHRRDFDPVLMAGLLDEYEPEISLASGIAPWRNGRAIAVFNGRGKLGELDLSSGTVAMLPGVNDSLPEYAYRSIREPGVSYLGGRILVDPADGRRVTEVWKLFPTVEKVGELPCWSGGPHTVVELAPGRCATIGKRFLHTRDGTVGSWGEGDQRNHWVVSRQGYALPAGARTWPYSSGVPVFGPDAGIAYRLTDTEYSSGAAFLPGGERFLVGAPAGRRDTVLHRKDSELRAYTTLEGERADAYALDYSVTDLVLSAATGRILTLGYRSRPDASVEMVVGSYGVDPLRELASFSVPVNGVQVGRLVLDELSNILYYCVGFPERIVAIAVPIAQ